MYETETTKVGSRLNKIVKYKHDIEENIRRGVDIHALSEELIIEVVTTLIVHELKEEIPEKLAKFQTESKLDYRISRRVNELKSVCRKWESSLSNSPVYLKKKILHQLRCTGIRPLLIRSQLFSELQVLVVKLQDKIYVLCRTRNGTMLKVYGDNFQLEKSVSLDQIGRVMEFIACHNCLYAVTNEGIWRIMPDNFEQNLWLVMNTLGTATDWPHVNLSASKDGNLLISNRYTRMIKIYGPNADLLRSMKIPNVFDQGHYLLPKYALSDVFEKRTGNLAICHSESADTCMTEVDVDLKTVWSIRIKENIHFRRALLDSTDNVLMIDKACRQIYVLDANQECHIASLDGVDNIPNVNDSYMEDFQYDENTNVLYIAFSNFYVPFRQALDRLIKESG